MFNVQCSILSRLLLSGVFGYIGAAPRSVRVVSLGGGPGFELLAFREFFALYYPHVTLDLVSVDLEKSWGKYAELLVCKLFVFSAIL